LALADADSRPLVPIAQAAMPAPCSLEELLHLIRSSGVVEEDSLDSYLDRREASHDLAPDRRAVLEDMVREGLLTHFQAEQFLQGKISGFTIGPFRILERIGVGGMGHVYLCEGPAQPRRVAVKVLPPAKADQPAALGRFYREARAAACLDHPNIVRTHEINQDGNLHYIVMDYFEGSNLLDIVKKFGPLDIGRAVSYALQVARGLDHAFRNGIVHRDIKPGNILIDRHGVARVLDMGLARFYKDHTDLLTLKYDDRVVLGTADYVAPEQVANSHGVDIRADIYALGATLYFLLAGQPPFPIGTVSQKLLWHRTKEPAPVEQVRPEVPRDLAALVALMMSKDPQERFQTPAQVVAELEPWLPASVALPAPEEMPRLSRAAIEDSINDEEERSSSSAMSDTPLSTPAPSTLPSPALAQSPADVAVSVAPDAPARPVGRSAQARLGIAVTALVVLASLVLLRIFI
jgi:serine/threonine protein kinase